MNEYTAAELAVIFEAMRLKESQFGANEFRSGVMKKLSEDIAHKKEIAALDFEDCLSCKL